MNKEGGKVMTGKGRWERTKPKYGCGGAREMLGGAEGKKDV